MKKIVFLILAFLTFNLNVLAKTDNGITCEYTANYASSKWFIKYKFTYYNDGTLDKEIEHSSKIGSTYNLVPYYDSNDNEIGSISALSDNEFNSESIKTYYEKGQCPYIAVKDNSSSGVTISPVEDTSQHDPVLTHTWVSKYTKGHTFGDGKIEAPKEPKLTTICEYHFDKNKIPNVPQFTIAFSMYDDLKMYYNVYLTENGQDSGKNINVTNKTVSANITNNYGVTYSIILPEEELSNIYKITSLENMNNGIFTCPQASSLYIIEYDKSARIYQLTTDKKLAEEYGDKHSTGLEEGNGNTSSGTTIPDKDLNFEGDPNECSTYLGDGSRGTPLYYLNIVFKIIKYAAIIILLVLTVVDFTKAVTSDKDDAIKKASMTAVKRLILAVIIFFLPILIGFILELLGISGAGTCGIK